MIILLCVAVMLIGLIIYLAVAPGSKLLIVGLNMFTVGLLVFLLRFGTEVLKLGK